MTVTRREMKPGETIFGGGTGSLIPFAPQSSTNSKEPSNPSPMKQYTEAEIQAELKKMKEEGYGTTEISMAETLMKGLEGKPEGNA